MTSIARHVAVLVCVFAVSACSGPGGASNVSDTCPGGERFVDIDTISLVSKQNGVDIPIDNGAILPMVFGAQGSGMLLLGLRVTGRDVPSCVQQQTSAETLDGTLIDDEFRSMRMRQDVDGGYVSGQIILIVSHFVSAGDTVILKGVMSGLEVERYVFIDELGTVPPSDAGPRPDSGPVDAAVPDASPADAGGVDADTTDAGDVDALVSDAG